MSVEIAIIAALEREVRPLVRGWTHGQLGAAGAEFPMFSQGNALVVCSGMGGALARQAAVAVFAAKHPALIVSAGFAGALDSSLKVGDVVQPQTIVDIGTGARYDTSGGEGVLVSASSVLDRDAKRRIAGAFAARAVDMEAASVALVADQHHCPFIAVKAVSDEAGSAMLPFDRFVDTRGRIRTAGVIAHCAVHPATWPTLARLAGSSSRASKELCRALNHLIEQQRTVSQPELSEHIS